MMENPSLTYINGAYVLLFSGNNWNSANYATGYAVCTGPFGSVREAVVQPPHEVGDRHLGSRRR